MIVLCKKSPINVVMMGKKSQALVSGIFFYLDTIYTTRYVTVHL